jgi:hypothetical protein
MIDHYATLKDPYRTPFALRLMEVVLAILGLAMLVEVSVLIALVAKL